eukprot:1160339-Pelagomonas_calceolata.AAC.3
MEQCVSPSAFVCVSLVQAREATADSACVQVHLFVCLLCKCARQLQTARCWTHDPGGPCNCFILFIAKTLVDSKNEAVWGSWIAMERDLGFTERADELEIKLNENRSGR